MKKTRDAAPYIALAVASGIGIVFGAGWWFSSWCNDPDMTDGFCGVVRTSPPWPLLTALATIPVLWLTWTWRENHKRAEEATARMQAETALKQVSNAEKQGIEQERHRIYRRIYTLAVKAEFRLRELTARLGVPDFDRLDLELAEHYMTRRKFPLDAVKEIRALYGSNLSKVGPKMREYDRLVDFNRAERAIMELQGAMWMHALYLSSAVRQKTDDLRNGMWAFFNPRLPGRSEGRLPDEKGVHEKLAALENAMRAELGIPPD